MGEYTPAAFVPSRADIARRIQREEAAAQRVALSAIGDQLGAFADEIKGLVQASRVPSPEGGDELMKQIRLRVRTGTADDGSPVVRRIGAYDELTLADKVVQAVVESGRIYEFLSVPEPAAPAQEIVEVKPEPAKHPFDEYIEAWLKTYKTGLAVETDVYNSAKKNVLIRFFGRTPIEDITVASVQAFVTERSEKFSHNTVKGDLAMLRELLDSAVYDRLIGQNPARDKRIKNKAKKGKGTTPFTRTQIADIQANIPRLTNPVQRCLLGLLAYTSMRREEVLGLKWQNVDLDADTLKIDAAVVYAKGTQVKDTKNEYSVREFPICSALHDILQGCKQDYGYVIHGKDPLAPINGGAYRYMWASMTKNINLYGLTAKSFRTTFATMALASGVDIRTAQGLMGHSDPETTLKHYAKLEQTAVEGAMDKINGFVKK